MKSPYEQIESYLNGDLDAAASITFEQAMLADADLSTAVAEHRRVLRYLDALRLKNKVRAALSQPVRPSKRFVAERLIWVLGLFCAVGGLAWWLSQGRPTPAVLPQPPQPEAVPAPRPPDGIPGPSAATEPPVAPHAPTQQPWIAMAKAQLIPYETTHLRGEALEPGNLPPLRQAELAFEAGDFRQTLRQLAATQADDEASQFLRAHAYFKLGDFGKAKDCFEQLRQSFKYRHEAQWNTMACQLALGQQVAAMRALQAMRAEADFPYAKKAAALAAQLR
jgi:tetratricopeptide (TPR) repeat protein